MHVRTAMVPVQQPFDFSLTLAFLRGFSPMMGEQRIEGGALTKSWIVGGQPVTVRVEARERDSLTCHLASPRAITGELENAIATRVRSFLSADEDVEPFYEIARRDQAFAPVARRLRGLHHPRFATPFEAACWSVINQRVQLAQARSMKAAIIAKWGQRGFDAFPEATTLAKVTEAEMTRVMGNQRKARAVLAVSGAFAKIGVEWLQTAPIGEVEAWLHRIYGVGDFAAGFILYRGLGRAIALPWGPKFVDAARKTYAGATRATLEKKAEAYGPWRGLWALYLWAFTFIGNVDEGGPRLL